MHWYTTDTSTAKSALSPRHNTSTGKRVEIYAAAKAKPPERWSGNTRNWTPIAAVTLNPDKPVWEKMRDAA